MFGGSRARKIAQLEEENAYLRMRYLKSSFELTVLQSKWNQLVSRINALGGEEFLSGGERCRHQPARQFDKSELRCLLQLCHPDKHGNSALAQRMTAKLLEMKE